MIKIVSTIKKSRDSLMQPWIVGTAAVDDEPLAVPRYIMGAADLALTFTDAIGVAAQQRKNIEQTLMDAAYDDRFERREAAQA